MKIRFPSFTRREFIEKTTAASAFTSMGGAVLAPRMLQTPSAPAGKKGQAYPDERRSYTDSKSGRKVWQLTNMPSGRTASWSYYNVPKTTPDGRWGVYTSDRASATAGRLNIFKMDLRTGESVQLTESSDIETRDGVTLTADGREVYFFDREKNLRVVDMLSFQERKIMQLPANAGSPRHNNSVSTDKRFIVTARPLEPRTRYTYLSEWASHNALIGIRTDTGEMHYVVEGMFPIGINEFCPTNDDLVMWDIHIGWEQTHRPWIIRVDGTENRPVMPTIKGEGSGHQYWGWSGEKVYSVLNGGHYPQGLWQADLDGSNERCVQIGGTHAHCASSPDDNLHVGDELWGETDHLWISRTNSPKPEILCQIAPWFEQTEPGVVGTTPFHPHARFTPQGTAVAFSGKGLNGSGNMWMVEL